MARISPMSVLAFFPAEIMVAAESAVEAELLVKLVLLVEPVLLDEFVPEVELLANSACSPELLSALPDECAW